MSLINNVLRDLDKRRNTSESASVDLDLVPVSESPGEQNNQWLIYVTAGLIIVAAVLGYWWMQSGSVPVSQQLDIQIATPAPGPAEQEGTEPVATGQAPTSSSAISSSETADLAKQPTPQQPTIAEVLVELPPLQPPARMPEEATPPASDESEIQTEPAPDQAVAVESFTSPVPTTAQKGESALPVASVEQQENPQADDRAVDSIKNQAEFTAEEWDMKAVQEALRLIANNNSPTAYALLENQVRENRYAYQSRETYAKLLINDGEYIAGYQLIEAGLELAPNHAGFKKLKARILIANGQITEAAELLSGRAPAISKDPEYYDILATAQLASRDYEGALISYRELLGQNRGHGKWWYGFGAAHDALGNSNSARQAYSQAVQQADLSPNLRRRSQERLAVLSP